MSTKIAFFETSENDEAFITKHAPKLNCLFHKGILAEEHLDALRDIEILSVFIYSKVTEAVLERLPHLKLIATRSTGYDHVDTAACKKRGIVVVNVPTYGENTVAEHTFALILSLSRYVHKSYARGLEGDFSTTGFLGFDLKEKSLGVIGTGRIGMHVIRIAKGFGMNVLAYDVKHDQFLSEILDFDYTTLEDVLTNSDIMSLHVPYLESTRHLINRDTIQKMKRGSLLINTSRGGIVDNEALIEGLDSGILAGAGLDVLEGEEFIKGEEKFIAEPKTRSQIKALAQSQNILSRDNIVYTPHIAFYSKEALERILQTTLENIDEFSRERIQNKVE